MVAAIPKSISDQIFDSINSLIEKTSYQDENSIDVKRILKEIDKLMPIEPAQANLAKALVYQCCGNVQQVDYHVKVADKLPCINKTHLNLNFAIAYSNLGLHSLALGYLNKVDEPDQAYFDHIVGAFKGNLSLFKFNELLIKAKKMKLDFDADNFKLTSKATEVLRKHSINDIDVAKYADVFGLVLRENNFVSKGVPDVIVSDHEHGDMDTVFVTFKINADTKTAAKLYKESTKRLISTYNSIPDGIHFSVEAY